MCGGPNKRFEQTNQGHDSEHRPKRSGAVVCGSTPRRQAYTQVAVTVLYVVAVPMA